MSFLDNILGPPDKPTESPFDRIQGTHFLLQTVVVPPLAVYAQVNNLSLRDGIAKAILQGVTFAQVQANPQFNTIMGGMGGVLNGLMGQYGEAAKLRPGETVEGSADWILKQTAGMKFTTSSGPVLGLEIYAPVVSTPGGKEWFQALIRDIYATLGVGRQ